MTRSFISESLSVISIMMAARTFVGNFGLPAQLFRNDGLDADGRLKFVDISIDAGIDGLFPVAAANFTDVDGDDRLDLYVGRDGADVLWLNRGTTDGITQFC